MALLEAKAPAHALYNVSSDRDWGGLTPWCERLRAAYPAFRYRVAAAGEATNLAIAETQDRGVMDISRLRTDVGFEPRFGPAEAYEDYIRWLLEHGPFAP